MSSSAQAPALFTVFTPTYNRASSLPRLCRSLKKQSFVNFEWLVVDDGSTDGTAEVIDALRSEVTFPIRYFWQANRHKKVAVNKGVAEAQGELFLTADSDDELLPNALERLAFHWHNIPQNARERFSAVTGLCQTPDGRLVGTRFPRGADGDWCDSDSLEMRFIHRVIGEKCGFHRTSVLREFPFPEHIPGYVSEGLIWWAIAAAGWRTRFVNEPLRVYHVTQNGESITSQDPARHAPGLSHFYKATAAFVLPYLSSRPTLVYRHFAALTAWSLMNGESPRSFLFKSREPLQTALTLAAFPAGAAHVAGYRLKRLPRSWR